MKHVNRHPHLLFAVVVAGFWFALTVDWSEVSAATSAALSSLRAVKSPAPVAAHNPRRAAHSGLSVRHTGSLIQGSDGQAYGLAMVIDDEQNAGPVNQWGAVVRFSETGELSILHSFAYTDGAFPAGSLIEAGDRFLIGVTTEGGANGNGTIFRLRTDGSEFSTLHHFAGGTGGARPLAGLIEDQSGNLYGTTGQGGQKNRGTIYRLSATGEVKVLHAFSDEEGAEPASHLLASADGYLYGTTRQGGRGDRGTIFRLRMDGSEFQTLRQFKQKEGSRLAAELTEDTGGWLYGVAASGGAQNQGTLFRLTKDGSAFAVLHRFNPDETQGTGWRDGSHPLMVRLALDGYLYGTTREGGAQGYGVLYRVRPDGAEYQVLYSFSGAGEDPWAGLIGARDGKIYLSAGLAGIARKTGAPIFPGFAPGKGGEASIDSLLTTQAVFTVTNVNDSGAGSLRNAIASANSGDTINIVVTGTITLTSGELAIGKNLTITGPGTASLTVSGNNSSRVFLILPGTSTQPGPTVTISGLTIANGLAKGGNGGCGGSGGGGGGGVGGGMLIGKGANVTLRNITFQNNRAVGGNGGNGNGCGNGFTGGGGGGGLSTINGVGSPGINAGSNGGNGGDGGALGSPGIGGGECGNGGIGGGAGAGGGGGGAGSSSFGVNACGGGFGANKFFAGGGGGGGGLVPGNGGYSTFGGGGGAGGFLPVPTNNDVPNGTGGSGAGRGGNGGRCYPCGGGGGGGAGVGGGLFVWSEFFLANSQTTVNLVNCSFTGNTVQAGTGGLGGNGSENGASGYTRGADAYFMESETLSECSTNFGNAYFERNFFINHLPFPITSIGGSNPVCMNTSYTVATPDAGAGATYSWTVFNGTITGGQGTRTLTYTTGTNTNADFTYVTVTVTGPNGCAATDARVFNFFASPVITAPNQVCPASTGLSASIPDAGAGATYNWTINNGGTITGGQGTRQITFSSGATDTTLNVSVTIPNAPCALIGSKVIAVSGSTNPPDTTISVNLNGSCPGTTGNTASVPDAGAGATYAWSITNGTITAGQNARVVTFTTSTSPTITLSVAIRTTTGCGSATRNVSVLSPVPPVLTCQDMLYSADLGTNGAIVNYPIPVAADFCGGVTVVCNPPPGSFFPIGKLNGPNFGLGGPTPVTCTAVDLQGTSRSCTFKMNIDHIAPQFTARPTQITVSPNPNQCQALVDLSQYFQATGAPQPVLKYKYNPAPGQPTFESTPANPTPFPVGTTTLYVFATNSVTLANGPFAFTVTVRETTPPTINCPANITAQSTGNACSTVVNFTVTAADSNCPNVTIVSDPPSGSAFPVGTTVVSSTATDASGNQSACTFTVTVTDNSPPSIVCPANIIVPNDPGSCSAAVNFTVLASDDCSTVTVVSTPASGATFPLGTTTVTSTATDAAGNSRTCMFTVTVTDTTAPIINCPASLIRSADPGACSTVVTYTASASDQCSNATVMCSPPSGATFSRGITTVTCTGTDGSGNTSGCNFTVTVSDNEAPKSCVTPPAGLISWWSGDGHAGDIQGSNNGTLQNGAMATGAGKVGQAFSFDGVNDCVSVANHATLNGFSSATIDAWIKLNTVSGRQAIISKVPAGEYYLLVNNGRLSFENDNLGAGAFTGATLLSANLWYHVAVTYDGVNTRLYVNGVEDGNRAGVWSNANTQPLTIGQRGSNEDFFNGLIDEVEIFNRALSVVDIQSLYNAGSFGKCKPVLASAAAGQCSTAVNYQSPGFSDNCTTAGINCQPASGSVFQKGVTTVSCTVSDTAGNSFANAFVVKVNDQELPMISCPSPVVVGNGSGQCQAVVNYPLPVASDNCTTVTTVCTPAPGQAFPKGTTTVSCTATDGMNNTATCTFTVTVNDTQAPVVNGCTNLTANTPANGCSTAVTYPPITATDNCQVAGTPVCTPPSGSMFQKGTTTVTCSVSDTSSNQASCSFTVTVTDRTPPTLSCPPNKVQSTDANQCQAVVTYANATATDNCPNVGSVSCSPSSGSPFPKGTTTVSCTATDASGNVGSCSFTVTVNDTQAPALTCPANITRGTDANLCSAVVSFSATASDNCSGASTSCTPASGAIFPKGVTTVSCTATDTSGNQSAPCAFTVTVNDTQPPAIMCPANLTRATDPNQCLAVVSYALPAVSDNCPGVGVPVCTPASGTAFPKGTTTVSCAVRDASNQQSVCSFSVTVTDAQAPQINCPANLITNTVNAGDATVAVTFAIPIATDNCPGAAVVCVPASGSLFPRGTTTVSCTATDAASNRTSCSFTVRVFDYTIVDDTNGKEIRFDSLTGEYDFFDCRKGTSMSGRGTVTLSTCKAELRDTGPDPKHPDRNIYAAGNPCTKTGSATISSGGVTHSLTDANLSNNPITCSSP
jgi:uncharacterized repeat protein (TIGR03803 family)